MRVLGPSVLGLVLLGATGCGSLTPTVNSPFAGDPLAARLDGDVALGYRAYRDALAGWGRWSPDALAGAHWCPNVDRDAFQPYRTGGKWTPASTAQAAAYHVAAGMPVWAATSGAPWEEITFHHGRWTRPDEEADGTWCWVPGTDATAGAVVWRTGGGFVGWAAEPVDDDYDHEDPDGLCWTYEFLATLFDDLTSAVLQGNAADQASQATSPSDPPRRPAVQGARRDLLAYLEAREPKEGQGKTEPGKEPPRVPATPATGTRSPRGAGEAEGATASAGEGGGKASGGRGESSGSKSGSKGGGSASSSSSSSEIKLGKVTISIGAVDFDDDFHMPPAMAVYRMMADPAAVAGPPLPVAMAAREPLAGVTGGSESGPGGGGTRVASVDGYHSGGRTGKLYAAQNPSTTTSSSHTSGHSSSSSGSHASGHSSGSHSGGHR